MNDSDDWFDAEAKQGDVERQLAENDLNKMHEQLEKEGYREGLVRVTEEEELQLQKKGFEDGYNAGKQQFKVQQAIELVLGNQPLFKKELIQMCLEIQDKKNYDQVDLDQLLKQ